MILLECVLLLLECSLFIHCLAALEGAGIISMKDEGGVSLTFFYFFLGGAGRCGDYSDEGRRWFFPDW